MKTIELMNRYSRNSHSHLFIISISLCCHRRLHIALQWIIIHMSFHVLSCTNNELHVAEYSWEKPFFTSHLRSLHESQNFFHSQVSWWNRHNSAITGCLPDVHRAESRDPRRHWYQPQALSTQQGKQMRLKWDEQYYRVKLLNMSMWTIRRIGNTETLSTYNLFYRAKARIMAAVTGKCLV